MLLDYGMQYLLRLRNLVVGTVLTLLIVHALAADAEHGITAATLLLPAVLRARKV